MQAASYFNLSDDSVTLDGDSFTLICNEDIWAAWRMEAKEICEPVINEIIN